LIFPVPITVTSLRVFEVDFQKRELHSVPARAFHSLTFRYSGSVIVEGKGEKVLSEADSITYMPAGIPYQSQILDSGYMTAVHFEVLHRGIADKPVVIKPGNPEAFRHLFAALAETDAGEPGSYLSMALFYELLGTLELEVARQREPSRRMAEAKQYIDRNYGSRELSVQQLADRAGISQVHFRKEFREQFEMGPLAYIRFVRLNNAKIFLKTGYYSVTETAVKCGFDSLSYFCSVFHRFTGSTPGAYQKKYNKD